MNQPSSRLYSLAIQDGSMVFTPIAELGGHVLPIRWIGQNTARPDDDYSNSDCGPACVAMWLDYLGVTVTVDDVSKATGLPRGYKGTVFADLDRASRQYGLDLDHKMVTLTLEMMRSEIDAGRPVIALVYYPSLPERFSQTFAGSHWILIVGYDDRERFYYHDPYWLNEAGGADKPITAQALRAALMDVTRNGNAPLQGATQKVGE